jgi:hypothetical protein
MAVGANSYGTAAQVAALTPRYTKAGEFKADGTTNPTLATVEGWIDSASATINVCLAAAGFSIPVTQADAKAAVAQVVVEAVADLCHYANSSGRFYTERALERGVAPMKVLRQEMADWVEAQADGLELLGAARTRASTAGILFRDSDQRGNPTAPIFQRDGFANRFEDWDS